MVDPLGKRTGVDPTAGTNYREIPHFAYLSEEAAERTMVLDIKQPIDGEYELTISGTGAGDYTLDIQGRDQNGDVNGRRYFRRIPTNSETVHRYLLNYSSLPNTPIGISGGFKADGYTPADTSALLTYASPISAETRLRAAQTTFPLLIFYGGSIHPVTFHAVLNDTNISSRFTPAPETFERVLLPLHHGSNIMVISVDGTTAAGDKTTETDRLVFWVP